MAKKSQIDKFRETARKIGADVDEDKFDAMLRKMAHGTNEESAKAADEMAEMLGQKEPNTPRPKPRKDP